MYLAGVILAFIAAILWESMFYHRNDGGLKSMSRKEWVEDIFISLLSWLGLLLIGIAYYVAICHKDVYESFTGRKL